MKNMQHILLYSDTYGVRLCLAFASLIWAVLLLWNGDTFVRETYSVMRQFAPEEVWGIAFLVHSLGTFYSLFWEEESSKVFVVDAVLGCVLFTTSAVSMLVAVYPPPAAISSEIVAAMASWWVFVRWNINNNKKG